MPRKKKEIQVKVPTKKYKHKDFLYIPDITEDYEKDVYKVVHWVELPSGKRIEADFSPYLVMSRLDFETYVDLECPKRMVSHRPLSTNDLRRWRGNLKVQ